MNLLSDRIAIFEQECVIFCAGRQLDGNEICDFLYWTAIGRQLDGIAVQQNRHF